MTSRSATLKQFARGTAAAALMTFASWSLASGALQADTGKPLPRNVQNVVVADRHGHGHGDDEGGFDFHHGDHSGRH